MSHLIQKSLGLLTFACFVALVGPVWTTPVHGATTVVVVAHPDVPESHIDQQELIRVFLGKRTRWSDDVTIVPVLLKNSPVHQTFVEDYLDRSVQRFVTYWRQIVFTGKGVPPKTLATEADVIAHVAATPGAIGYVSGGQPLTGVKVISIK